VATTLTRAEGRQIPGALGDPIRAVDLMPGVTPTVSGLPLYYVRGSPPGNIGYFIDEVRIPLLYHAFLGPSVIHPELIDQVTLYPGPYPANYGRHAGAIVAADLRVPRHEFGYRAELGIYDSGGYVETPFAGDRGAFFFGGRYSYMGALVSAFSPNTLEFWNYQSLIEYDLTLQDKVSAFLIGAFDYLESDLPGVTVEPQGQFFGTEFHRVDLRYDRSFGADTSARAAFTMGIDRTRWTDGKLLDKVLGGRLRLQHRFSDQVVWRSGMSLNQDSFDLELDNLSLIHISEPTRPIG
jgi:outer membrane receptor protein involved in Fe transport